MAAIGCLLLIVLPLLGLTGGGWLAGPVGAKWGAGAGFIIAVTVCGVAGYALAKTGRGR